jgi:hypothetical protein
VPPQARLLREVTRNTWIVFEPYERCLPDPGRHCIPPDSGWDRFWHHTHNLVTAGRPSSRSDQDRTNTVAGRGDLRALRAVATGIL